VSDHIRLAVVGLGKIAQDQHLPAIARARDFELVAAASPVGTAPGVPHFPSLEALLASGIAFDGAILCQPPQFRFSDAAMALQAGKHVLLEKPPGASVLEGEQLLQLAQQSGRTLFAAWHSRFAPAIEPARTWLGGRTIRAVRIEWRENVRQWHPGQAWIWEPGGFGVFDPGINALSILTELLREPLRVLQGTLEFPSNRHTPIGAQLSLCSLSDIPIQASFDWRQAGPPQWSILMETDAGQLRLLDGGAALLLDGVTRSAGEAHEYAGIYEHFSTLIRAGRSEADLAPLRLVADAFLRCRRLTVAAFD